MTSVWRPEHLADLKVPRANEAPLITAADVRPISIDHDVWDMWPLALADGSPAPVLGGELWMFLAAPRFDDPGLRHDCAQIRLFHRVADAWRDLGPIWPSHLSPGAREWSGSALLAPESGRVALFFTAAGRPGRPERRFEQRLFSAVARLETVGDLPYLTDWSTPKEIVAADGADYVVTGEAPPTPGFIKGFRDPGYVHDPADGGDYVLFTGSAATSRHAFNGVIGWARASEAGLGAWTLLPPLVSADGLCNEMERPHVILRDGLYYLFWSSQTGVFAPDGPQGPTGLYGMVAKRLAGPYRPLNGSGLVLANPAAAPAQAYCWRVTPDLRVISFIDAWRDDTRAPGGRAFGGTVAPTLRLALDGKKARLAD